MMAIYLPHMCECDKVLRLVLRVFIQTVPHSPPSHRAAASISSLTAGGSGFASSVTFLLLAAYISHSHSHRALGQWSEENTLINSLTSGYIQRLTLRFQARAPKIL